jgi:hypothetical protein
MSKFDPAERLKNLSPAKRALLLKTMQERVARAAATRTIPRRALVGPCPLSFAQQGLWFIDQMEPGGTAFVSSVILNLEGRLNLAALEQSVNEILRRHESLRTTFLLVAGRPVQNVIPEMRLALSVSDMEGLDAGAQGRTVARLVRDATRPFDLARGPMLRVALLRLGRQRHMLLFTVHDIASDGWSRGLLVGELRVLYRAFSAGAPSSLAELPIQYADFAVWQRESLQGEGDGRQMEYWRRQLANLPGLNLPSDRPRPAVPSYRTSTVPVTLRESLMAPLKRLARGEGATLFMVLLAAFQVLQARYTGQEDVVVGTPVSGRGRVETEGLIGFFVNMLALRTNLAGEPTFLELLRRVKESVLESFTHQDLPLEKIVEEMQPERSLGHLPLFQVTFAFQNVPRETLNLPELSLSTASASAGSMRFDLALTLNEDEQTDRLSGFLAYNTDLFEEATVRRMLGHFETLLEGVNADPGQSVWALPLMPEGERHEVLVELNDNRTSFRGLERGCAAVAP